MHCLHRVSRNRGNINELFALCMKDQENKVRNKEL